MTEKERGREPANGSAHLNEYPEIAEDAGRVQLNADGSVTMASLDELSDWVLDIAATCGSEVAEKARYVRQLCAARGGTSNTSQTAGRFLAHPRLKSVTLTNDHRALLERVEGAGAASAIDGRRDRQDARTRAASSRSSAMRGRHQGQAPS